MDQLKPILEQCKKHLFWIVTGVAVLFGIVAFFLLSGSLNSAYDKQEQALDTHYSNIQQVSSAASTHPNEKSQQQMQVIIDSVAEEVRQAWEMQYERQSKFLVWPKSIKKDNFALVSKLEALHPIEQTTEFPTPIPGITKSYKTIYAKYFDSDMPRLAKIIGVNWKGEAADAASTSGQMGGGGGYGSDGGYGDDYGGDGYGDDGGYGEGGGYGSGVPVAPLRDLIVWSADSQSELLNSIRMWNSTAPSVYEILYTQENMWILEGLFNIIRKTNGKAKANFQCVIKEIEFIRIGRTAIGRAGDISAAGASKSIYGGMGGDYGGGDDYGGDDYGAEGGDDYYGGEMGGDDGELGPVSDPANRRYVDANFVAVSGEDLRTRMQSSAPEDAYFAVAKRVPVRMRFSMDQRKVHEFLANCGSADLMLEVRQVRLGDTEPAALSGASGGYGDMLDGGGMDGMSMGQGGYGDASAAALGPANFDVDVEVYGVVYLFNPVDLERLGLNQVTEDTELETTVENTSDAGAALAPPVQPADPSGENGGDPAADAGTPEADSAQPPAAGQAPAAGQPAAAGGPAPGQPAAAGTTPEAAAQPAGGAAQPAGTPPAGGQPAAAGNGQ